MNIFPRVSSDRIENFLETEAGQNYIRNTLMHNDNPLFQMPGLHVRGNRYFRAGHPKESIEMTKERIDQVLDKLIENGQFPNIAYDSYLTRKLLLENVLENIYSPFYAYLEELRHANPEHWNDFERGGLSAEDPYYHGLHRYLMQSENNLTREDVERYIALHRMQPESFRELEYERIHDLLENSGFWYPHYRHPMRRGVRYDLQS